MLVLDGEPVHHTGLVVWLQGPTVFVDVRAPGGPGNDTAFAGTTAWRDGSLTWRHALDRRERDGHVDTGRVHFDGDALIESGEDMFGARVYRERWERMAPTGDIAERAEPRFIAVRLGDHAAAIVDRRDDGGDFAACYWRRDLERWSPHITIGDPLPDPEELFRLPEAPATPPRALNDLVREAIVVGGYAPGERLTEERLAADFGVSRSPVREALRSLASEGFVRTGHYAGTFVAELGEHEVEDLLEIRRAIESLAARRAAERRTDEQLDAMADTIEDARKALVDEDFGALVALNSRFHTALAAASGNTILMPLLEQLRAKIAWVYAADVRARAHDSWEEHADLLDAVRAGEGDRAAAVALDHVASATAAYRRRS